MSLTIALSPEDEKKLVDRAAARGKDVTAYVEQLIRREIDTPLSLIEAGAGFERAVTAANITDEEFDEILSSALAEARAERRARD